jgi:hypothetical protein
LVTINPGAGRPLIRTGVDIPYSDEFRGRATNDSLLIQLAEVTPRGGTPGALVDAPQGLADIDSLLETNHFRHDLPKGRSSQDVWHYVVLIGGCLFFFDVFFRRVQVSFAWVPRLAGRARDRLFGRETKEAEPETIERLRSRKQAVGSEIDKLRAATRFEPSDTAEGKIAVLEDEAVDSTRPAGQPPSLLTDREEETYTERLLRAKKKAWEERRRDEDR